MTKQERKERLIPGGIPRYVRCYDNGGIDDPSGRGSGDRYTVVYTGRFPWDALGPRWCQYKTMSGEPFHPQGICLSGESRNMIDVNKWGFAPAVGRRGRLGKRIRFQDLPTDCRKIIRQDYRELWEM